MRIGPLSPYTVEAEVESLRRREEPGAEPVTAVVRDLIDSVRAQGDEAVLEATRRLDWPGAERGLLRVSEAEIEDAFHSLDDETIGALEAARSNLTWFHEREMRRSWEDRAPHGQLLGIRFLPVARAGLYVPGGLAAYPSSVIMNAVPARVAGVKHIFVCTPPDQDGRVNASILAAAHLMEIEEVYRVGGAQAIAAMAFGTETIPRADVISGPGNAYVNEAKRQVYGAVGIDGLAGPSEVLILADESARADWVAVDLLAQVEHGSGAVAVLLASTEELCRRVEAEVERLIAQSGDQEEATAAWGLDEAVAGRLEGRPIAAYYPAAGEGFTAVALALADAFAPEHLELHLADPRGLLDDVTAAGAVFIGEETPTAIGDYLAGTNHVLPTGGAARFSSPLSVDTFLRKSWTCEMTPEAAAALNGPAALLADREGFTYHARSLRLRRS
ncbi:MAG: histidinol dehydrogenase [Thermoleophilia bacterium]